MGTEIQAHDITESINKWLHTSSLNKNEQGQFLEIAKAFQLNPWKREIYGIAYGNGERRKLSIITGYEVYLKRAERTGLLDGYSVELFGTLQPCQWSKPGYNGSPDRKFPGLKEAEYGSVMARVTIYRKDRKYPVIHDTYWCEAFQENDMWGRMGRFMLKKVAMAQGFRLAFPDELGGMPYTADELPDNITTTTLAEAVEITSSAAQTKPKAIEALPIAQEEKEPEKAAQEPVQQAQPQVTEVEQKAAPKAVEAQAKPVKEDPAPKGGELEDDKEQPKGQVNEHGYPFIDDPAAPSHVQQKAEADLIARISKKLSADEMKSIVGMIPEGNVRLRFILDARRFYGSEANKLETFTKPLSDYGIDGDEGFLSTSKKTLTPEYLPF